MYIADVNESQLKDADVFDKSINGKLHNGPASFSNDGNCMAFTKNNSNGGKENVIRLEINFSTFKDGEWSKPESFSLNSLQYSVGHPSLSADGNTMYFASDMPGGFGGVDIYKVTKSSGGTWGKAVNLGPKINTEGDELFPFFEEKSGVLFFSSNGHFGLGGLDIFYCYIEGSMVGRIRNAGYPVNTQYDDFAGIVNDKLSSGYFSSNRSGGHGGDDIYGVDLLKPLDYGKKIQGVVKDDNGNALPEVFVKLSDDKDSVIETLTANTDGTFFFLVDSNKSFKLNGKKETYTEGNNIANTFGKEFIVIADLTLLKKEEVVIQVIPDLTKAPSGTDLTKVLSLKNIYFDYDKYNIRKDAEVELAKIILVLNQYPNMVVELEANTDCRGTIAYNQILSDKRANSSIKYIQQRITNPSRISGKGYGKSKLINGCECDGVVASECSENEHQLNRRTEFIIIDESITSAK
ncbi:MAG: OmpA family protein [Bacteroidota bacterium]